MTLKTSLLRQLENPELNSDERAELHCRIARKLEDKGDYEGAREAIGELWPTGDERQHLEGLEPSTVADVLLRAGVVTGWRDSDKGAQERAKNLLSESISIFESLNYTTRILEAQTELAYCYWREGQYDEARIMLKSVLEQLEADSELKAKAVLRSAIVEWASLRYSDSLYILSNAARLFEKIQNHTIIGGYHNALAGVLEDLGACERREDYTDRAFVEYAAASYHFEQAGHKRYLANVENNLGFLYFKVSNFNKAHEHLDRARHILVGLKDTSTVAQVDETRARVLLAERRYAEAERVAKTAVRALEKGDRQSLLAEALTTHGVALARLGAQAQSRLTLYRGIEIAHLAGANNTAGLAALAILEELHDYLWAEELNSVFKRAYYWLSDSQHLQTLQRLLQAANCVQDAEQRPQKAARGLEIDEEGTMREVVSRYEHKLIGEALERGEGSVTQAARLFGITYQRLIYTLEHRHPDLLPKRTPVKKRRRSFRELKS